MENIIFNELVGRGYSVDVGVVVANERNSLGKNIRVQREIDFVVNRDKGILNLGIYDFLLDPAAIG